MKVFFTAWLLINGAWTHGSWEDGWFPVNAQTEEKCQEYVDFTLANPLEGVMFTCESEEDTLKYMNDLLR